MLDGNPLFVTVTPVTIGLEQTAYTVIEDDTIVLVCTAVQSGSIAGRTITIDYATADDTAEGKCRRHCSPLLVYVVISFLPASSDYSSASGNFDMTDTNTVQCIPITIISDNNSENSSECFTYTISSTASTAGLTLSLTTATVCINDEHSKR